MAIELHVTSVTALVTSEPRERQIYDGRGDDRRVKGRFLDGAGRPVSVVSAVVVAEPVGLLPVGMLTAGLIDRAIDRWEEQFSASTVKNTVAALVLVLDEAVRDELLRRNPAKDRARRKTVGGTAPVEVVNPRDLALPDVATCAG